MDIHESERNLNNKIGRGGLQCGVLVSMFDGDRDYIGPVVKFTLGAFIVFALVMTIWNIASNTAYEDANRQRHADQYASSTKKRIESDCLNREPAAIAQCVQEIIDATREDERSEHDLYAQRGMERWAFWMAIISLTGVGVTALGVGYVALTLKEARETTRAAVSGASAARRANQIAEANARSERMAAHDQLRILRDTESPHVFVEEVRAAVPILYEWADLPEKEIPIFVVHYEVANYGRTPAIITEKRASIYFGDDLPGEPTWYPSDTTTDELVIAAGKSRTAVCFYRLPITHVMLNDLGVSQSYVPGRKQTKVFLFGQIQYRGVNGIADEIRFCFEYRPAPADFFIPDDRPNYSYRRRRDVRSGYTRGQS